MTSPEERPGEQGTDLLAKLFDIRSFTGVLFLIFGVIVTIVGLTASDADIQKSAGLNLALLIGPIMFVFGAIFIVNHGRTWNALLQYANVNRDDSEKGPHSVSATAARISGIEVGHGRPLGPGTLKLSLGYERFAHTSLDESNDSVRVLVQWHTGR